MSVTWKDKVCEITLEHEFIEGIESGLFEDLKYRPNKYFHPIEHIAVMGDVCSITYQRELVPVDGRIALEQVLHVLQGAVDATQRLAQDQVFYMYPDVSAFVQDRRRNLRIGLINVRPIKDRERSAQELCVDAFCQLLAEHCPEGHRKVMAHNESIMTLRHLQQVLTQKNSSPLLLSLLILLIIGGVSYGSLLKWGPPRIQQQLQQTNQRVLSFGKRFLRSGSDEWHAQAKSDRRKREYAYPPVPFTLIIETKTQHPKQNERIYRVVSEFLMREFPAHAKPRIRYQLLIPDAVKFPKAHAKWSQLCSSVFSRRCKPHSWLLHFPAYTGGWRPLVEAVREAVREVRNQATKADRELLKVRYISLAGLLQVDSYQVRAQKPTQKQKNKKAHQPPPRRTAAPKKAPDAPILQRDVLTPRTQPKPRRNVPIRAKTSTSKAQ